MTHPENDKPGVIARPPLIFLGAIVLGIVVDAVWPVALVGDALRYWLGGLFIAGGACGMFGSVRLFRRAGTNVETSKPTNALVIRGLYRFSRNPIYVSMSLLHVGIAIMADNAWMLGLLIPVLLVIQYGVIAREERYLESKFSDDYRRYKASVRRWL